MRGSQLYFKKPAKAFEDALPLGSGNDMDGVARYSSTANSFRAISGMIKNDLSMKESIKKAFAALDSKYGVMTFDKPFDIKTFDYVGRIARITPGTFENAEAVYCV